MIRCFRADCQFNVNSFCAFNESITIGADLKCQLFTPRKNYAYLPPVSFTPVSFALAYRPKPTTEAKIDKVAKIKSKIRSSSRKSQFAVRKDTL